jgi:outer membrane protein assembly factor BamB/actin-like ATPase involved in cell morphogenesis
VVEPVLAVDFGTSVSSATLVTGSRDNDIRVEDPLLSESPSWPSAVYWKGGTLLVGMQAENQRPVSPWSYRSEFKRALREKTPMVLGDQEFMPVELVTRMLEAVRLEAEKRCGMRVSRGVLTVPPSYTELGDERAELMLQAGRDAGFTESVELLPEPVAAVRARLVPPFEPDDLVLVYDFGGGTFDAALVRIGESGNDYRVPAISLDRCGGVDIDASISEWLLDKHAELSALLPEKARYGEDQSALRTLMELSACCRKLKQQLSGDAEHAETIFREMRITLELDQLNQLAAPWVAMTVRCCRDLLKAAKVLPEAVDAVMLVGGGSKMKLVYDMLHREFGRPIRRPLDPALAVVQGAAEFARMAPGRFLPPAGAEPGERAVRWQIPGGVARLLRWHVQPGDSYGRDTDLAEVRLPMGEIYRLRDRDDGIVREVHAGLNQPVRSGDWLLTAAWPFREWHAGPGISDVSQVAGVSPGVSGGRIFFGTKSGVVEARVAATGALCWRRDIGSEVTTSVTITDGGAFVGSKDGRVHVLDEQTGWPLRQPYQADKAVYSTPAVSAGMVCFGSDDGRFYAFHPGQKEPRVFPADKRIRAMPVVASRIIYVAVAHGSLYALDAATATPAEGWDPVPGAGNWQPWVADDGVYACFDDNTIRKLDAASGRTLASGNLPPPPDGPAPDGRGGRWLARVEQAAKRLPVPLAPLFATPPVLAAGAGDVGAVYVGTTDGRLVTFSADTLEMLKEKQISASAVQGLAVAGGMIYAGSSDRHLYAVTTADSGFADCWRYEAMGGIDSAPVVADGAVFVTSADGYLHALDAAGGKR